MQIQWYKSVAIGLAGLSVGFSLVTSGVARAQTSPTEDDVVVDTEPNPSDPSTVPAPTANGNRFSCQFVNGQYTVMYNPESQPDKLYPWANPSAMGSGWTPERRCNEISRRLESYRPDGLLEMRTAVENGYNTVCVTTQKTSDCRIVLTVPVGQDPTITRDRVFQNISVADSGQQTQAVNTYSERGWNGALGNGSLGRNSDRWLSKLPNLVRSRSSSSGINLRPFLDPADGGTGRNLQGGISISPGRRLNPASFR